MSLFGYGTVLYLLIALYKKVKRVEVSEEYVQGLGVLVVLQAVFIAPEAVCLYSVWSPAYSVLLGWSLIIGVTVQSYLLLSRLTRKGYQYLHGAMLPLMAVVVAGLVYTEFYNGVYTFDSVAEFRAYQEPLKEHYIVTPFKVSDTQGTFLESQADVFHLPGTLLLPRGIKLGQGNLYYYVPSGFGEIGRWFQYGIPQVQQI